MVLMQPKELLSLPPGWGQAFQRVSSAGRTLTVQGQEVPTRVHARRGARWRGRGVIHLSNNRAAWGPSAGRCKDPTELRWEAAGGVGPGHRTAPRARQPALLPAPSRTGKGRGAGGRED